MWVFKCMRNTQSALCVDWKTQNSGYGAKCITPAMPFPACSAGCPLEDLLSPLAAPRVLQHLNPALCHPPWPVLAHLELELSSCLPPLTHLTQHFSSSHRVPGVLQHHIQHSLTTGTSFLTPLPPAFVVSKEGIPDSCQHPPSAVTSQAAQRMHPRSGIRNSVCRGAAG